MKRVTLGRFAFQYRSKAEWEASQVILYAGELVIEGDTGLMKVGDGKHLYSELPYFNRGEKGEKGETGAALAVKGTKDSTASLPPQGKAGDAYIVDGNLYVWSDTKWIDAGLIKGNKGDEGPPGPPGVPGPKGEPLRYTDLTQAQKQEIANIVNVDLSPYAKKSELKTRLSELEADSAHVTVTEEEKAKVQAIPENPKYTDTVPDLTKYATKTDLADLNVSDKLADMEEDSNHRTVTDGEKLSWNAKLSTLNNKDAGLATVTPQSNNTKTLKNWIGDLDARINNLKNGGEIKTIYASSNSAFVATRFGRIVLLNAYEASTEDIARFKFSSDADKPTGIFGIGATKTKSDGSLVATLMSIRPTGLTFNGGAGNKFTFSGAYIAKG